MTLRLPYVTFQFTAHHVFLSFLYNDSHSTLSPHTKTGLCFNEPAPQGEKNDYLFRHQGEESLPPPHLFHVCVYSCVAEGRSFLFFFFCMSFLWLYFPWALLPLSAWQGTQIVGDTTGWGADVMAQLSVSFPCFTPSLIFAKSVSLALFLVFISLPVNLSLSVNLTHISHPNLYAFPPFHPSISHLV